MDNPNSGAIPPTTSVQMLDFRKRLGGFVERAHYHFSQFRLIRKDKPMARLVSEPYMQAVEHLLEENPTLTETVEIMLDQTFSEALRRDDRDVAEGKVYPIETVLEG